MTTSSAPPDLHRRRAARSHACARSLVIALGLVAPGCIATGPAPPPRPNFIVILADDQGWTGTSVELLPGDPSSASDYHRTPALERLAAQGLRFSNAYAPAPNCSPSRCSILTGLGVARTGMTDLINRRGLDASGPLISAPNVQAMAHDRVVLPEMLKAIDPRYQTAHFGKWHLGSDGPPRHLIDQSDGLTANSAGNADLPDDPKRTFSVTDRSIEFLEQQVRREKPFYLQVSYYAVHLEIEALDATRAACEARPRGARHVVPDYAAMTEDLDTGVGRLLDAIERLGLAENTYVIYTSDNGGLLEDGVTNNLPLRNGKTSLWEGGIRVPLIVRGPGIAPGSHSPARVIGFDLYPTICDLVGPDGRVPDDLDGGSLKPLLLAADASGASDAAAGASPQVARRDDFLVFHFPHYQIPKGTAPQSALLRGHYKLMKFWEDGAFELYDLDRDPGETTDLADALPELARELDRTLVDYLRAVAAPMPRPNPAWTPARQAEFDASFGVAAP